MPDPVITDPNAEKKEKPLGVEVREKSFHQILKEQQEEKQKAADPVETEEEKAAKAKAKEAEEKKTKDEDEAKAKQEADRKLEDDRQAAIAKNAAEEVVKKQEEEKQRELDRVKAEEAEKERQEALKPKFTGVDEKGNAVPKSYEELAEESARVAEEKALTRLRAEQDEKDVKAKQEQEQQAQQTEQQKQAQKAAEDQLQAELDADLNDLYANNKLPKVVDPKDENDPGNKEFRNLFETAQKVNADRMAKGLAPIRSIKLIYYEHYKPLEKPAGSAAPVFGAEPVLNNQPSEDKYIPARDRNKSISQLVREEAVRLSKKVGIRSK